MTRADLPKAYFGGTVTDENGSCHLIALDHNGPASKAGLKTGDVILKVNGREILLSASFRRWISESRPGETLNLQVRRGGKLFSLNVNLATKPAES
jgi:serine protease Do